MFDMFGVTQKQLEALCKVVDKNTDEIFKGFNDLSDKVKQLELEIKELKERK